MKVYTIPPVKHLELAHMGDKCYYALAHLYYQNGEYRKFFKAARERGDFVTLDNSAAERSLVTEDILIEIVRDLQPHEVIAPDILLDRDATLVSLDRFIKRIKKEKLDHVNIFGCPQGKDQMEWMQCYLEMLNNSYVKTIGLSKIAVPYCWYNKTSKDKHIKEARHKCVRFLVENDLIKKPIHCLGQGDPEEFRVYKHPLIRSTDSCYPILAAIHGIQYGKNFKRIETHNDYFSTSMTEEQVKLALWNIFYLKTMTR